MSFAKSHSSLAGHQSLEENEHAGLTWYDNSFLW